jgi:hypothetical protein
LRVVLQALNAGKLIGHTLHAALFGPQHADARRTALDIHAVAAAATYAFYAVFAVRQEDIEALVTGIADIIIGRHGYILTDLLPRVQISRMGKDVEKGPVWYNIGMPARPNLEGLSGGSE